MGELRATTEAFVAKNGRCPTASRGRARRRSVGTAVHRRLPGAERARRRRRVEGRRRRHRHHRRRPLLGLSPRAATIVGLALVAACGQRAPLLPSDDAVRACMTGSACGTTDFFGECISELVTIGRDPQELALSRHLSAAQASCLAAAGTDCNAARACLDLGVAATPCTSTASRCDGDVVRYCNERVAPATRRRSIARRWGCVVSSILSVSPTAPTAHAARPR